MKNCHRFARLAAAACVVWMAGAASLVAQRASMTERGYREMRRLADRLDQAAQHAADQARHQESWVYRNDNRFDRAVSDFARRADRFNDRMANYRAAPFHVDEDLRNLLRSAESVQNIARTSREPDNHTISDWNETVAVLNRMIRLWDADVRLSGRYEWNAPLPEFHAESQGWGPGQGQGYNRRQSHDQLAGLARELNERATRAHQLAESAMGNPRGRAHRDYFDRIHHFNDQAREFDQLVSSRNADYRALREQAQQLLDDARKADADMRQHNVFPEVWQEWQGAMQTLQRITSALGA